MTILLVLMEVAQIRWQVIMMKMRLVMMDLVKVFIILHSQIKQQLVQDILQIMVGQMAITVTRVTIFKALRFIQRQLVNMLKYTFLNGS